MDIEAPLRKAVDRATSERDRLLTEKYEVEKDEKLRESASQFPEPYRALPVVREMCAECETGTEAAEKVFPVLLEELARSRYRYRRPVVVETEKSAREVLLEMFEPGPPRRSRRRGSAPVEIDPALVGDDFAEV